MEKLHNLGVNEIACLIDFGVAEDLVLSNLHHIQKLKDLVRRQKRQYDYMVERINRLDESENTATLIKKHQVSHIQSTPSFYEEMLEHEAGKAALQHIDTLLVGGEALKSSVAKELLETVKSPVFNMYGPTETTIWSAVKKIDTPEAVTIGTPVANTQIYVLDTQLELCPTGISGELYIAGDGVAKGYLNNETLTAAGFIDNPFSPGQKMYKTGDLARWLSNGELEYLGRIDRQVKVRGYRIELKEIESVIMEIPGVIQSVVSTLRKNRQTYLAAYVKGGIEPVEDVVKNFLRLRLPNYMIPQHVIFLETFPYTPNGKIDIKKLPVPEEKAAQLSAHVAPRNELEQKLVQIWEEFLNLEKISIDDNFFEIGGNSMKAFQLLSVINAALDIDLKIISFFQFPTIRTLAEDIKPRKSANVVEIEENEMENVDDLIDFMKNV